MGLSHLVFPEAVVNFSGGSFTVRGLTVEHIAFLVQSHSAKLNGVFNLFTEKAKDGGDIEGQELGAVLMPFLQSAPEVIAHIIACGSGNPKEASMAAQLPLPVQIEAMEHIIGFTFDAEGGPKKLMETVIRLAQGTTGLLQNLSN
jgi:hypothetical protein